MTWDPAVYETFKSEREAPFADLAGLIRVRSGMRVIDLGCGTGALTARLAAMLPESVVLGIDASAEMLAAAPTAVPGLGFERRAIEQASGDYDLVFSHAALQWLDDHESLIPRVFALVAPGGQFAVQVPSNQDHPAHRVLGEVGAEEPFVTALGGWQRVSTVLGIERYAEILFGLGATGIVAMERVYPHVMADADALLHWARGTAMTPYIARLPDDLRAEFAERYREALWTRYPTGPVFYAFKRTLLAASRPS